MDLLEAPLDATFLFVGHELHRMHLLVRLTGGARFASQRLVPLQDVSRRRNDEDDLHQRVHRASQQLGDSPLTYP